MPATVAVPASLHALLHGVVDYAALFPPARRPLEETVRRYLAHQTGPHAWILGRLVLPVARLDDLGALPGVLMPGAPLRLSVLAGHGAAPDTFAAHLAGDLEALAAFQQCFDAEVRVEALEVRLPERLRQVADVQAVLQGLWEAIDHAAPGTVPLTALFLEVPRSERQQALVEALSEALPAFDLPRLHVGLKLRCGGLRPEAIPSADFVASFLAACRRAGVRFKATAGLHHPLRHWDAVLGVPAHGFLNVLGAAVLARVHPIGPARIRRILEADEPEALRFDDDGLTWDDLHAGLEQIRDARTHAATAFGSCSFAEPVRALRRLGWLP